jgi:membrane fusion protein (multidrug efflux system)
MFRNEALARYGRARAEGRVLRIAPYGTTHAFYVLMAVLLAALAWTLLATIHEYAIGPALVRAKARHTVTAAVAGTVEQIHARPGQSVRAGDALLTLYAEQARSELMRMDSELDLHILRVLQEPLTRAARDAVTELRAERELAQRQLEQRIVRAPVPGRVSDLRARLGQHVVPGEVLVSVVDNATAYEVLALLPGQYRPQLAAGLPLRLELDGYRFAYTQARIEAVGDELIGPVDMVRQLGTDTLQPDGPTVLVTARLPRSTFDAKGRRLAYYDGMRASARVRVQSESVLLSILPALRALSRSSDDER